MRYRDTIRQVVTMHIRLISHNAVHLQSFERANSQMRYSEASEWYIQVLVHGCLRLYLTYMLCLTSKSYIARRNRSFERCCT